MKDRASLLMWGIIAAAAGWAFWAMIGTYGCGGQFGGVDIDSLPDQIISPQEIDLRTGCYPLNLTKVGIGQEEIYSNEIGESKPRPLGFAIQDGCGYPVEGYYVEVRFMTQRVEDCNETQEWEEGLSFAPRPSGDTNSRGEYWIDQLYDPDIDEFTATHMQVWMDDVVFTFRPLRCMPGQVILL